MYAWLLTAFALLRCPGHRGLPLWLRCSPWSCCQLQKNPSHLRWHAENREVTGATPYGQCCFSPALCTAPPLPASGLLAKPPSAVRCGAAPEGAGSDALHASAQRSPAPASRASTCEPALRTPSAQDAGGRDPRKIQVKLSPL